MKSKIHLTTIQSFTLVALALLGFALLPSLQAVVPAPDGGYPNFTTAEGTNALKNLTTGIGNTAVGWYSLFSDTIADLNTGVGAGALAFNNDDFNTAVGVSALYNNTTGSDNTAVGSNSLFNNIAGTLNTATGSSALYNNTSGASNTANGYIALWANTTGYLNTAVGYQALYNNITGFSNAATGAEALYRNTEGVRNTAMGALALLNNLTGNSNTAVGHSALFNNTGSDNTAVGVNAGLNLTAGNGNVCIGQGVGGANGESGVTRIRNIGSTPIIDGTSVVVYGTGGLGDGALGYISSSQRYKQDIKPMDKASEALFALKPVTFRAKGNMDPGRVKHYGLIAEDVAGVDSDLVVYNPDGKPETLRFNSINAMLLNEFLKEHRKVEQQQATIEQLKKDFRTVTAQQQKEIQLLSTQLKQQAEQSAQAAMSKAMPNVVLSSP